MSGKAQRSLVRTVFVKGIRQGRCLGDSNLVRDLLRKAEGDTIKVASWLEVMGENVSPEELQSEWVHYEAGTGGDDVDAAASQLGAPETFFCPISYHLFRDPVLLQTGQTYDGLWFVWD